MFHPFWKKDEAVVTVDYVVVMAALVGVGVWMADTTNADLSEHSAVIRGEMQGGMFETAWDADLAVQPDTDAGDQCTGADTCGTDGGTTGGGTTGGGTTGGGTTGGGTTDPDPDPNPDPDPTPDPDPDPTPDPDPDPTPDPDPDPDPTPDPDPDPDPGTTGGGTDPAPPPATGAVAGCPNNAYNGEPLVSDGSDFGSTYDQTITHSGYTDLRTCGGSFPYARGFFDANPTYSMYLSNMDQFSTVEFLIEATTCDTTILIRDAAGNYFFNDDYVDWRIHTRSRLQLSSTADLNGRVDIWIGGWSPSTCSSTMQVTGY